MCDTMLMMEEMPKIMLVIQAQYIRVLNFLIKQTLCMVIQSVCVLFVLQCLFTSRCQICIVGREKLFQNPFGIVSILVRVVSVSLMLHLVYSNNNSHFAF